MSNRIAYDETSPSGLTYLVDVPYGSHPKKAGDPAGYLNEKGYWKFNINGKVKFNHRYIWETVNGAIPKGMEIDHINGVKSDNRLSNLRLATRSQNCTNQLGIKGYSYNKKAKVFRVRISIDGKQTHIGDFKTEEEAARVAKEARQAAYGEYAGY